MEPGSLTEPPRGREFLWITCWGLFTEDWSSRPSSSLYSLLSMRPKVETGINEAEGLKGKQTAFVSVWGHAAGPLHKEAIIPTTLKTVPGHGTELLRPATQPGQVVHALMETWQHANQEHCTAIQPHILYEVNMALFDGRSFLKSLEEQ